MKKPIWWLVGIIVIIVIIIAISSGSNRNSGPIKIGFIGALTGDASEYGQPQMQALQIAVGDINSNGGVNGRPVEIVFEDGKCTGKDAANATQKLVNVDHVQVILGGSCSSEDLAAIPIVEPAKVFIFTGSASSPALIDKSPFFARDYPNDNSQGSVLADASIKKGWKDIAVIDEQTDYAQGIIKAFGDVFTKSGGIVTTESFPTESTDFRASLSKLKSANPDALFISTQSAAAANRVMKQVQDLKWKIAIIVNDVPGMDKDFLSTYKTALEGAYTADFFLDQNNPKFTSLSQAYKNRFGKDMAYPNYTATVYDSLYIVADAIKSVGYNGEKIASWVRTLKNFDGASGKVTIGSNGERVGGHALKVIRSGVPEFVQG